MEACLAILVREEEQAAPMAADGVLQVRPTTLFLVPRVLAAMRLTVAALDTPAPLETFVPAVPNDFVDRPLGHRCATSCTLIAALELARFGGASVEQEPSTGQVVVVAQSNGECFQPSEHPVIKPNKVVDLATSEEPPELHPHADLTKNLSIDRPPAHIPDTQ